MHIRACLGRPSTRAKGCGYRLKKSTRNRRISLQRAPAVDDDDPKIRLEVLAADLEKLAAGWTPDAVMLASCPLLDQWSVVRYPGTADLAMQG
jgi:hypothetical protein